jgi:tetratricopeptide (TPR) repeat protein
MLSRQVDGSGMERLPRMKRNRFMSSSSTLFVSNSTYTEEEHVERVEPPSQSSLLVQQTVQWLQERGSTHLNSLWSGHDVAMAQNLLQQWYSDVSRNVLAPRFASLILQRWLLDRSLSDGDTTELLHHLHRVLHLWQRNSIPPQQNRACNVLQSFHQYSLQRDEPRVLPTPKAYSMVFEVLSQQCAASPSESLSEMISTADQLLEQMTEQYHNQQAEQNPPWLLADLVVAQNSYLNFRVKSQQPPEGSEEFVLHIMLQPNARSFAAVLQHWVLHNQPDRACALLERMLQSDFDVRPDLVCFNICLQGLGHAGEGTRAQTLLGEMIRLAYDHKQMQPDEYSYLAVINAWAKSNTPEKAIQALEQMISHLQEKVSRNNGVPLTSAIYTTVLDAVARHPNSGPIVEAMLQRLEQEEADTPPNREAYTVAIRAWGSTRSQWDAPDHATDLLLRMQNLQSRRDLAPCTIAYTSLIHAWAQSGRNEAPQRALTILRHMEQLYLQNVALSASGKQLVAPDTIALNVVLFAFARHGLAREAHELLDEMKKRMLNRDSQNSLIVPIYPDVISWATVVQAYINSGRPDSAIQAYDLLLEIEELYESTGDLSLRSTPDLYTLVILAQEQNAVKAESILWRMVDRYLRAVLNSTSHEPSSIPCAPNTSVCNAVLRVCSKSDDPVAPQKAESILHWMENQMNQQTNSFLDLAPDKSSFQFVVDAWKRSRRRNAQQHIQMIKAKMDRKYPHLRFY